MAFKLLAEGKADFFHHKIGDVCAASYRVSGSNLRFEVASPMVALVENFTILGERLQHEKTGHLWFGEGDFSRHWLGRMFRDRAVVVVPEAGEFYVCPGKENVFCPEDRTYGNGVLVQMRKMLDDEIIIGQLNAKGRRWHYFSVQASDRPMPKEVVKCEVHECVFRPETGTYPRLEGVRRGIVAFIFGDYSVSSIESISAREANSEITIIKGRYTFKPTELGTKILKATNQTLRDCYKFRAAVKPSRALNESPEFIAWDWGYTTEKGYQSENVKE